MIIETERLVLRPLEDADLDAYTAINADPETMRYFPCLWPRKESATSIKRAQKRIKTIGYHFLAAELIETGELIGVIGLARVMDELKSLSDAKETVEIGWRLSSKFWGQGLAPEGALACLDYGFEVLGQPEIISFTARINQPSRRVMEKIGMVRDPKSDFEHTGLPEGHVLRPHVTYRMNAPTSQTAQTAQTD